MAHLHLRHLENGASSRCIGTNHNDVNVVSNRLPKPYLPEKLLYLVFSHRQIFL